MNFFKVSVPSFSVNSHNYLYLSWRYVLASFRYATVTPRRLVVVLIFKIPKIILKSVILAWFLGGGDLFEKGEEKLGGISVVDFDLGIFPSHSGL